MDRLYGISEIFYSLQGEGVRAGTPCIFVRFAGCNLRCQKDPGPLSPGGWDCDTDHSKKASMSAEDIRVKCQEVGASCQDIVFTGGEPGLQLDVELMYELRSYRTAIETNGTTDVSKLGLDWITVSPKVVYPIIQFAANEVKYVMPVGRPLPEATVKARYKLLSPCFQGKDVDPLSLSWCIDLVKKNPEWRLSFQQHKLWGIQ